MSSWYYRWDNGPWARASGGWRNKAEIVAAIKKLNPDRSGRCLLTVRKAGKGRPPNAEPMTSIHVAITQSMADTLNDIAEKNGVKVADVARMSLARTIDKGSP